MNKPQKDNQLPDTQIPSIDDLDTNKLRSEMVAGMYNLESSLYKQAVMENARLEKLRGSISLLENNIFTEEFINNISDKNKIILYKTASENVQSIMNFMMSLHKSIEGGMEVLNQIEEMKTQKNNISNNAIEVEDTGIKKQISDLIKNKIKEKVNK